MDERLYGLPSYRNTFETALAATLKLNLEPQPAEELIAAIRDRTGSLLHWGKKPFDAARRVIEKIANVGNTLYSRHTPPAPIQELSREIPTEFHGRSLPAEAFTEEQQRILNLQEIIRERRRQIDIIVDETGTRQFSQGEPSKEKQLALKSLNAILQFPNVRWAIQPPRIQTRSSDAFYPLPGTIVHFSRSPHEDSEGATHGDQADDYTIHTGEPAEADLAEKRATHEELIQTGRSNGYFKSLLNQLS